MTYVTDTHAFLWYLANDLRLSRKARLVFDQAEAGEATIVVPTIVVAECLYVLEKKRLSLKFKDVVRRLEKGWNYTTMPLDLRVIGGLEGLRAVPELHDRIIVASAIYLEAPLITKDEAIRKTGYVEAVW